MEEKATKTSLKQRIIIGFIAFLMLGSFIAMYVAIVLGGNSSKTDDTKSNIDTVKASELYTAYTDKQKEVESAAKPLSDQYFADFSQYKSQVKSYNSTTANEGGVKTNDLKPGTGTEITKDNTNYLAYYIGWCSDETIFDSSLDDNSKPTALKAPLDPSMGLIEGWNQGVVGMKLGGVREITVPGELAYGESQEICDGKNSPLKFIIMAIAKTEPLTTLLNEQQEAYYRYMYYANYGMDYDEMMRSENAEINNE